MTFELYHTHHSTFSQKVRISLAEKGLPNKDKDWVAHEVDLGKFEHLTPEYLQLNPNGVVPTLIHDGSVLIESFAPERFGPKNPSGESDIEGMDALH